MFICAKRTHTLGFSYGWTLFLVIQPVRSTPSPWASRVISALTAVISQTWIVLPSPWLEVCHYLSVQQLVGVLMISF